MLIHLVYHIYVYLNPRYYSIKFLKKEDQRDIMYHFSKKLKLAFAAALCGISLCAITPAKPAQASSAARIVLPIKHGYTRANIIKINNGDYSVKHKLAKASEIGMKENQYTDTNPDDNRTVDLKHLSNSDKVMLSKYTLDLINQGRRQFKQPKWYYTKSAQRFANRIATQYTKNNRSCWDADHYVPGILRAAKASGLNYHAGQIYEDEAGLPWASDKITGSVTKISNVKEGLYFNIKQMFFGGYYGNNVNDLSRYTEWEHAGDLLSARNNYLKKKQYGFSFSFNTDPRKISTHFISVHKSFIQNYKKYNH